MSTAVTLLAAGAKNDGGVSGALDVSAFSTLRLDATLKANHGREPVLTLSIETSSSANGQWEQIWSKRFCSGVSGVEAWPPDCIQKIRLGGFAEWVRVRWSGAAGAASNNQATDSTAGFDLSVTGVAQ